MKARVLHLITKAVRLGGAQRNTLTVMVGVSARFSCELLSGSDGDMIAAARARGIPAYVVPMTNQWLVPWRDVASLRDLTRFMREHRYDVVHTHSSKAGFLGRIAARRARVPAIVHTIHGTPFHSQRPWLLRQASIWSERIAARHCDRLIAVAQRVKDEYVEAGVCEPAQISVIYSGIDFSLFDEPVDVRRVRAELGIPPGHRLVGAVGHLVPCKGHLHLLEAAARVRSRHENVTFCIAGKGNMRPKLEQRIAELDLNGSVRLLGDRDDIPHLLPAFDLFCQPSLWEGLGRALTEAMYTARPVVASAVNAIPELVEDGETGLLVPPGDVPALENALLRLLGDPALAQTLGQNARAKVIPMMGAESMVRQTEALYLSLLGDRPAS
jgi:glycosyltransferase involved in cell wall biosynthesis